MIAESALLRSAIMRKSNPLNPGPADRAPTLYSSAKPREPGTRPSKLGWEVAVDFKADAHFDKSRSCP